MTSMSKLRLLAHVAIRDPEECADRIEAIITSRLEKRFAKRGEYPVQDERGVLSAIAIVLGAALDWKGVDEIEAEVRKRTGTLERVAPFTIRHHGDFSLARVCYAACRLLNPEVVLETGVAYGVTTAFVLKALQVNKKGVLHSIDLPPLGENADAYVGYLVPNPLIKDRWVLHRGVSKRILPKLLPQLERVDLFIHDSLHTYWNIRQELNMITPYLARPAVVIADDIQGNRAFSDWVREVKPEYWATFREEGKDAMAGVAVLM